MMFVKYEDQWIILCLENCEYGLLSRIKNFTNPGQANNK